MERDNHKMLLYGRVIQNQRLCWSAWLILIEIATKNHSSEATNLSPFFTLHGYHTRARTSLLPTSVPILGDPDSLTAATATQEIHNNLWSKMGHTQAIQAEGGN